MSKKINYVKFYADEYMANLEVAFGLRPSLYNLPISLGEELPNGDFQTLALGINPRTLQTNYLGLLKWGSNDDNPVGFTRYHFKANSSAEMRPCLCIKYSVNKKEYQDNDISFHENPRKALGLED